MWRYAAIAVSMVLLGALSCRATATGAAPVVPPGTINTIGGGGTGDGGPAVEAGLQPNGALGRDSSGHLYIGDISFDECRIRRVSDGRISTIGEGCLLAVQPDGTVYYRKYDCDIYGWKDGVTSHVAGQPSCGTDDAGDGGPAGSAVLAGILGFAAAPDGTVYVATFMRIRMVSHGLISTIAGTGICCGESGNGGPATQAKLEGGPLALDHAGRLYLASNPFGGGGVCEIRRIENGLIDHFAGSGVYDYPGRACAFSGDGGPIASAGIDPQALAFDANDTLYIAGNCRVRKVEGGLITTIAGTGEQRPPSNNGR